MGVCFLCAIKKLKLKIWKSSSVGQAQVRRHFLYIPVMRNSALYLLNYMTSSQHLPLHLSRISRISQCDFYGTTDRSERCRTGCPVGLATPSSPRKLVSLRTSFFEAPNSWRKIWIPCGVLRFKRQLYIHRLPQRKYKLDGAMSSCICFGRQPLRARERRDGRRMMQWLLPIPNDCCVCFNWHHAYRCWGLLMRILCTWEKTLSLAF